MAAATERSGVEEGGMAVKAQQDQTEHAEVMPEGTEVEAFFSAYEFKDSYNGSPWRCFASTTGNTGRPLFGRQVGIVVGEDVIDGQRAPPPWARPPPPWRRWHRS